jgi:hypothetical protein
MVDGGAGHRRMVTGHAASRNRLGQRMVASRSRMGRRQQWRDRVGLEHRGWTQAGRGASSDLGVSCLDAVDFRLRQRGDGAQPRSMRWAVDLSAPPAAPRRGRIVEEEDEGDEKNARWDGERCCSTRGGWEDFLYKKDIDTWVLLNSS